MTSRRVERTGVGRFQLQIPGPEQELLRELAAEMRAVLKGGRDEDPARRRLFPAALPDDPAGEAEYRQLLGDQLGESHLGALDALESSLDAGRLDEAQLLAWVRALNQLRLLLGTRLEVTEEGYERPVDDEDPRAPAFAVYDYLTWLQEEAIDALSGEDAGQGADG